MTAPASMLADPALDTPIRLAALMGLHVIYVFTHDSIALGQDGSTHQPVEQLAGLRAVPGLTVIRPADANETAVAWRVALEARDHPVALVLTRQNVDPRPARGRSGRFAGLASLYRRSRRRARRGSLRCLGAGRGRHARVW